LNPKAKYFESKHVWLVGASSGIGEQMALVLGSVRNIRLSISARRIERLEQLRTQILQLNPSARVHVAKLDVRVEQQIVSAYEEVVKQSGDLDVLIVNSGINQGGKRAQELTRADARNLLETNLMGAVNCIVTALPAMVRRNSGHIVTVSSLASQMGLPQSGLYCASKAGLSTFMEGLQLDLYQTRSAVNCTDIKPGFVETPILEGRTHPTPFLMDSKVCPSVVYHSRACGPFLLRLCM